MTAVQKLYEACEASFTCVQGVPDADAVARVRALLDDIKCADLGLQVDNSHTNGHAIDKQRTPVITYLHLYECEKFSMGIFCLPQSAVLPLHNHPGMTVFSKLLYGSMHVKSYDWVDPSDQVANANPSMPRLANPVKDHVLVAPCDTSILYPTSGGNIHSFMAVTSCAVLDVLAPPYHTSAGRPCVYYRLAGPPAQAHNNGEKAAVELEEFRPAGEFVVHRGIYRGPKIVVPRARQEIM